MHCVRPVGELQASAQLRLRLRRGTSGKARVDPGGEATYELMGVFPLLRAEPRAAYDEEKDMGPLAIELNAVDDPQASKIGTGAMAELESFERSART